MICAVKAGEDVSPADGKSGEDYYGRQETQEV